MAEKMIGIVAGVGPFTGLDLLEKILDQTAVNKSHRFDFGAGMTRRGRNEDHPLIALGFFIGSYFYHLQPQLAHHPVIEWLCQLDNGKGQVSRHFFLEGLKCVLIHHHVERVREQMRLTYLGWDTVLAFVM